MELCSISVHFGPFWSILSNAVHFGLVRSFWSHSVYYGPLQLTSFHLVHFGSLLTIRSTTVHSVHFHLLDVVHFGPFNLLQSHSVKDVVSNITLTRSQLCCPWSPRIWKAICNKQILLPLIYYSLCSVLIHKLIPGRVIRVDVRKACSVLVLLRLFGKLWTIVFWLLKVR